MLYLPALERQHWIVLTRRTLPHRKPSKSCHFLSDPVCFWRPSFLPSPHFPCPLSPDVLQLSLPNPGRGPPRRSRVMYGPVRPRIGALTPLSHSARWVQGELGCPPTSSLGGGRGGVNYLQRVFHMKQCPFLSLIALLSSDIEGRPVCITPLNGRIYNIKL